MYFGDFVIFRFWSLAFLFPFQRGASSGSGGYSKSSPSPYQSQLYDSWKTEWNGQYYDHFRSGPDPSMGHSTLPSTHTYMTKGGRRPSYDDDF